MSNPSLRPSSLRRLLLAWLLPGVALMLLASGVGAYLSASRNATQAFDRTLFNLALAFSNQVQWRAGELHFELQPQTRQVLLTDKFDEIRYVVFGPGGVVLSGEGDVLPADLQARAWPDDGHVFFDGRHGGKPVRGVALRTTLVGQEIVVAVSETLVKRELQVSEIVLNTLVPETLLFAATIALVLFGVNAGLRPLEDLRARLAARAPTDLQPIGTGQEPQELKPLVDEIDRHLARLGDALEAQRHFVSDAAHQLRTPIAALIAQLESARLESGDVRLDPILDSTRRLVRLVNQLLALARAEPGGITARPLDLRTIVEHEADNWLAAALGKEIDLGFELASAPVEGIELLLRELAGNLVDNAIRYTPAGGQVTVRVGQDRRGTFLAVDDSGPGVPPELHERVFERFFRGDGGAAGGCGLGLAIVRKIAGQHRAQVSIGRSFEGGASFKVHFPPVPPES